MPEINETSDLDQMLEEMRRFNPTQQPDPFANMSGFQKAMLPIGDFAAGFGGTKGPTQAIQERGDLLFQRQRESQLDKIRLRLGIFGAKRQSEEADIHRATAKLNQFKLVVESMKELDPESAKRMAQLILRDEKGNVPANIDEIFEAASKGRDRLTEMLSNPDLNLRDPKQRFMFYQAADKFLKDPKGFVEQETKARKESSEQRDRSEGLRIAEEVRTGKRDPVQAKAMLSALNLDPSKFLSKETGEVSPIGKLIADRDEYISKLSNAGLNLAQIQSHPDIEAFNAAIGKEMGQKADLSDVAGMRKEFTALSKDFIQVRDAYAKIVASSSDPSAAGDLALIFGYMKMLDPTSVVREGEFATAQNTAGVPDRVRNIYNKLLTGERLAPEQRNDFVNTAGKVFKAQLNQQSQLEKRFHNLANRSKFDPEQVVIDYVGDLRTTITRPKVKELEITVPGKGKFKVRPAD